MPDPSPPASLWGPEILAEREELLREAEQIAHVGSWAWDMRTGRVAWSDELYRILGIDSKEQATFERFIEAIHPDDRMSVQELAAHAATGTLAERADYRVVRSDGSVREISGLAQIFRDANGVPQRMVGVAMDVTEMRMLEADLRQKHKMEALGRLAGGLAHDFNNLLTVILLNVTALKRTAAGASRELQQIDDAAASAAALATQLLAFSRRSPRMPRPLDMNVVGALAVDMIQRLISENVHTTFVPSTSAATFVADESQIHQVFLNLALNARDAMPKGGELRIEVAIVERSNGRFVRTSVHDTGSGMDAPTRARVFEPFFTTKEAGKGTGLGLAIVFGIVADSGGFLEVESEPERGSTFRVYLPFQAVDARPHVRPPAKSDPGRGETIVLVEDSNEVRAAVARILREAGYEVVEAGRPSQILDSWPSIADRISVLVTDQVMPEMTGRDLALRLRQRKPDLPVVFLTGYDPDPRDLGTDRVWCVTKPITEEGFLANVREALSSG